jgi:hypothetical protein
MRCLRHSNADELDAVTKPGQLLFYGTFQRVEHVMVALDVWEPGRYVVVGARGGDSRVATAADAYFRNAFVDVALGTYRFRELQQVLDPFV